VNPIFQADGQVIPCLRPLSILGVRCELGVRPHHAAAHRPETLALLYALWRNWDPHKADRESNVQMQLEETMTRLDLEQLSLPTLLDLQLACLSSTR